MEMSTASKLREDTGVVTFVTAEERATEMQRLEMRGALVVPVETGGSLWEAVVESVERVLSDLGASVASEATSPEGVLTDLIFRAQQTGGALLVLALGPLRGSPGVLDVDNSATLRFLLAATRGHPLGLLLDASDRATLVYGPPVPLGRLLQNEERPPVPAPAPSGELLDGSWRSWVHALAAARGPQTLAVLERLFTSAYMPLGNAIAAGLDDSRALPVEKQPGMAAMLGIGALLRDSHGCTVQMLPIPEPLTVPDGWDCADAITTDGWDGERVLAFFGKAQPLSAASAEKVEAKKIDGSVGTGDSDDAPADGYFEIGSRRLPIWLQPYWDKTNKRWLASRKMVILLLERDADLAPVLAFNELSNNVQARTPWPWPHSEIGDVTNATDLLLGKYLTDTYGLPSIARAALTEAIQTVAHTRRFHPIREHLQGLNWDGKSRIDKWLVHVLGESPETLKPAMLEYLQIAGRCWLLGMVNRVMRPGCKFDYCPVLEGAGGLRKSTMVEILAGSDFYSDTPFEVGRGKEAQEQVQGLWLYEIAEMTHFSKAEVGAIKAFISSKVDRYREAYGATLSKFARQCVLVGTTNENTYLRDRTGNRRFWPIPVKHVINTEWLAKYRDQLLAEAYALYLVQTPYTPTPKQELRLFAPMQESRLVETA
ncbi:MAG: virulence-associated E family protein, partial [Myxococcales bacterium]